MNTITRQVNQPGKSQAPIPQVTPPPIPITDVSAVAVAADRIRARAYELYLKRRANGSFGNADSDWVQAERELNGVMRAPSDSESKANKNAARGEKLLASGD